MLTHWNRGTRICRSKLTSIGSDNGLSPGRRQVIIWTNIGILLIWDATVLIVTSLRCPFSFWTLDRDREMCGPIVSSKSGKYLAFFLFYMQHHYGVTVMCHETTCNTERKRHNFLITVCVRFKIGFRGILVTHKHNTDKFHCPSMILYILGDVIQMTDGGLQWLTCVCQQPSEEYEYKCIHDPKAFIRRTHRQYMNDNSESKIHVR